MRTPTDTWYPIAFAQDLDPSAPTRVTLHGRGLVLFADESGRWCCLPDRCPHRAARLSDGRCRDGRVECLYHGWTFDGRGACVEIPQLAADATIPSAARTTPVPLEVVDGLVWLWDGAPDAADPAAIARIDTLTRPDVHVIDYVTDLPYSQDAFVENVLDFAHIHVAHDGARGGGHRDHAGPLRFEIDERGAAGFTARFLSESRGEDAARATGATVTFDAPNLVHYVSTFDDDRVSGLALYSVALAPDRSRMLYRAYGNHWPEEDLRRPRWREHLHQMHLLEQDMAVVTGQVDELADDPRALRDAWLPIRSSDELVVRHRRWVDAHRRDDDPTRGWDDGEPGAATSSGARDRYALHTRHCASCREALTQASRQRDTGRTAAFTALVVAAAAPWPWSLVPAAVAVAGGWWARSAAATQALLTRGPPEDPAPPAER